MYLAKNASCLTILNELEVDLTFIRKLSFLMNVRSPSNSFRIVRYDAFFVGYIFVCKILKILLKNCVKNSNIKTLAKWGEGESINDH